MTVFVHTKQFPHQYGDLNLNYHQLKSDFVNLKRTLSLAAALPKFFRQRITLQQAEEAVKSLLATQVARFLEMARAQIYQRPGTPYSRLLKYAGCEFADLENNLNRHGLENTLAKLAGEGVFLTSDEFKGKTEVVRGGMSFRVSPKDFERRDSSAGFTMESSGTRNRPVATFNPLDWRALQVYGEAVFYSGHDLFSCVHAICEPVLAGRMTFVLKHAKLGIPTDRWFALDVAAHGPVEDRFHFLTASLVSKLGNWFGPGIAKPEYLVLRDLKPIVDWIQYTKRKKQHPCVTTVVSNAIRIARTAKETGLSLEGVTLHVSGEPLTQFKKNSLEEAGARIVLHYGPGGGVGSALGCGNAELFDEMHIPQTMFTLIENPRTVDYDNSAIHPLMVTTLHLAAPRFLFNVENGDCATLITRDCGCSLQKVGFTRHIHTVRSFEKMTSEGMNYSGADLFELLENTIPSEFGGGPGDYQLVEEEDPDGQTRLTLVVHPGVGQLDENKLLSRLQQGLGRESRNHRFMSRIWQEAGAFRIRRALPHASARGKVLPLHVKQKN